MDLKSKMDLFNKRWSLVQNDSYETSLNKFKIRILNAFENIDHLVTTDSVADFCQYYGIREIKSYDAFGERITGLNIESRLQNEFSEIELYRLIEIILTLKYISSVTLHEVVSNVVKAINLSNVNVSITANNNEIILYPRGEKLLDNELVDQPLSFLNDESSTHFTQALQFYQSKKYIKSAESLRRSIEEYTRYVLVNKKGLAENITELNKILKSKGNDPQIRSIISFCFNCIDQYFNDNSKHNDGDIDETENEFLIYQTGTLLRYLSKIKFENK